MMKKHNVDSALAQAWSSLETVLRGLAVRDQDGELYVQRPKKFTEKNDGSPRTIVGPLSLHSEMGCGAWFVVQDPHFIDKKGMWSFDGSYTLISAEKVAILYGPNHPLVVAKKVREGDTVLAGEQFGRRVYLDIQLTLPDIAGVSVKSFLNMCTAEEGHYLARIETNQKPELIRGGDYWSP